MAFLDENGAKLLAQKIIEKAGSGASATQNYSSYTKAGANQYVTAQNLDDKQTGILYSWIPTIDSIANNNSNNLCGLMSLDSYNNLNQLGTLVPRAMFSWVMIFYHEDNEINHGLSAVGSPISISFATGSSTNCSVRVYIQPVGGGSGDDYGKILAEVCPYKKSTVTITYNNKVARTRTTQYPNKAVAYVDYVKDAPMTINVVETA